MDPKDVRDLIKQAGGRVTEMAALPDGSGFATASFPLPKDHWSMATDYAVPPMPFRMGEDDYVVIADARMTRQEMANKIREACRYAYRASTMNGKEPDLDPDALCQNMIVGLIGYWTVNGRSSDEWANPTIAQSPDKEQ